MSLSPSFPWPATRSPRHKKSCEAEPCTCWACCARPFVYDNEWGLRTRRKGWPRAQGRQSSGQGQIQGYRTDAKNMLL